MKVSNETKIGALTAVAITVLVLGYNFLRGNDILSREQKFYATYSHVDGLNISKPVLVNGFQIGRVSDMKLQPSGRTVVEFKINKDYPIPQNSVARLMSTDLLGNKAIEFELGNSAVYAENKDTLRSNVERSLAETVQPVQKKAENIIAKMDSLLTSVNTILNPSFQKNVDRSFKSIANTLATIEGTTKKVDGLVGSEGGRIGKILANFESISNNLRNNNEHISHIVSNFDQLSNQVAKTNIQETLTNANKAISDLQVAINKINTGKGSISLLLNDDKLYNNLNNSAADLDKLMQDLKANPKRYVSFSIFGGKKND
ncbi:MlaD family protein [Mucilaginibacter arboris]|uniref:MCE family protein n=1 Tax=Mucilaginibacter arboris TaxID=2682090 RepID=A0A7K1SXD6_9SPHI|nr:MlaD family protein [Mucilaginibacter arboris]MVN21984.1 MCE family protein [Mucilaginibacter arboris]